MRVLEAMAAGLVVALVAALIAWRTGGDPVLVGAIAGLAGFIAWGVTGRTRQNYGGRGGWPWDI